MNQSYVQLCGHPCIHAQDTGWQSGVRSCITPGLLRHLVQELNVSTVVKERDDTTKFYIPNFHVCQTVSCERVSIAKSGILTSIVVILYTER